MANRDTEHQQHGSNSSKEWQEFIDIRIHERLSNLAPQFAESLGLKFTPPTLRSKMKTVGVMAAIAVGGGIVGGLTVKYIDRRRERKMTLEFDKDSNGQNRVRPVGSRASSLVA